MAEQPLEMPKWVKVETDASKNYGRFIAEPFERGFGTTVGNSLRRILLSSIRGAAVTAVRVDGAQHEYSTIKGVKEDVSEIILNLKQVELKLHSEEAKQVEYTASGPRKVSAGKLFKGQDVEVLSPSLPVFTMSKGAKVQMFLEVRTGRGYVPSEQNRDEDAPVGTIALDAVFSPVKKVNFRVEDARVGQRTDYDRLVLEVWTNGSIAPEEAVKMAAGILVEHFEVFVQLEEKPPSGPKRDTREQEERRKILQRSVSELELSVRAANCLKAAEIKTIGDLVQKTESEMLKYHNFGKKSLQEIKEILDGIGLSFETNIEEYVVGELEEE
jgi:DNA-directed RNA polymerase subunit alpha